MVLRGNNYNRVLLKNKIKLEFIFIDKLIRMYLQFNICCNFILYE